MINKKQFFAIVLLSGFAMTSVWADAPVVDLSQSVSNNANVVAASDNNAVSFSESNASLTIDQRVARLEQQMANVTQMNLASRLDDMQQQIQQLQGQLQEQAHEMQQLADQQKKFYQDVDQRLTQLQNGTPNRTANTVNNANLSASTASNSSSMGGQGNYQTAFSLLESKKYPEAVAAFNQYLQTYPHGQYAVNSHYWLGEIYFLQSKNELANKEFQIIVTQYAKDPKVPDALLKIAFINVNSGKHAEAREQLKKIIKDYPGTSAAQLATMRLKTL